MLRRSLSEKRRARFMDFLGDLLKYRNSINGINWSGSENVQITRFFVLFRPNCFASFFMEKCQKSVIFMCHRQWHVCKLFSFIMVIGGHPTIQIFVTQLLFLSQSSLQCEWKRSKCVKK